MDSVVQAMNGDQDDVKPVTVGLDYPTLRKRKVDQVCNSRSFCFFLYNIQPGLDSFILVMSSDNIFAGIWRAIGESLLMFIDMIILVGYQITDKGYQSLTGPMAQWI